jgi:pseudouridine-5'-phosphate glycosidase
MFNWSDDVAQAHNQNRPIVALESTVIAQGLPWPANLETALEQERVVREQGAVPATLAVIDGCIQVGLLHSHLEHLAHPRQDHSGFTKAGRRDLSALIASRGNAALTVSATLWLTHVLGLGVMATGGIGGVHRDASRSFDLSTDLNALAQAHGSLVVCSGVKSILDIPATLEVLETLGVPVIGYRTRSFPAFWSVSSGIPLETRADSPAQAAGIVQSHRALQLPGALLLAQPVPADQELPPSLAESAISQALYAAHTAGVTGKSLTPCLLESVRHHAGPQALAANRALLIQNACLAAQVAVELKKPYPVPIVAG